MLKIPYRLPELLAAPNDTPVFICEGEKDANRLAGLGLVATSGPGGAGKWAPELNRWFGLKRKMFICEDNDPPGREHAAQRAASIACAGRPGRSYSLLSRNSGSKVM